jgi:hypothetical protein
MKLSTLRFAETVVECVAHELGAGVLVGLGLDVHPVRLDRAHRQNSRPAISAFVWPSAIRRRMPTSRVVRWSGGPERPDSAAIRAPSAGLRYVPPDGAVRMASTNSAAPASLST